MADMHLMLVDGKLAEVDMGPVIRRFKGRHIKARADLIDQAADLLGDEAFTLEESYEAAEAAMPPGMVNSAGHIAATLAEVEHYGRIGE